MDDFGGKLRQARERRGISLRQISSSTKIAAAALDALEKNNISKLPGGIFSRAFVRSYAVEVGLDPDETVKEFLERFNQEPPPSAEAMAAAIPEEERHFEQRQRQAVKALGFGLALLLILIVIGIFWYRSQRAAPPADAPLAAASQSPAPVAAPEATAPPPADSGVSSAAPVAGQLKIELHPVSECWISLTVDGRKLFARVLQPGERESHIALREAVVEVGDAGAFAFTVNGRPGKSLGDKGQVKTLTLTPATASQFTR